MKPDSLAAFVDNDVKEDDVKVESQGGPLTRYAQKQMELNLACSSGDTSINNPSIDPLPSLPPQTTTPTTTNTTPTKTRTSTNPFEDSDSSPSSSSSVSDDGWGNEMASEVRLQRAVSAALKGGKTTPSPTPSPTKGVVYGKIREEEKVIEQENDNEDEKEDDNKNPFGNSTSSEDESDMPIKTASPPPPPSLKNQTAPPEPPLMLPKGFREYLGNGGEGRCLGLGNTHVEGKTQHTRLRAHMHV